MVPTRTSQSERAVFQPPRDELSAAGTTLKSSRPWGVPCTQLVSEGVGGLHASPAPADLPEDPDGDLLFSSLAFPATAFPSLDLPLSDTLPTFASVVTDDSAKSDSLSDPIIAEKPLTVPAVLNDQITSRALIDSGSQADVLSPSLAHRLGLTVRKLARPLQADLAADGQQVSLSLCTTIDTLRVGSSSLAERSVFICPLPSGIDLILGVPWFRDSGLAVSARSLFVAPEGPAQLVFDFESQGFVAALSTADLRDYGFVDRPMLDVEFTSFLSCALIAGVSIEEVTAAAESVGLEPHNPLLDIDEDDPLAPDLDEGEAARELSRLTSEFSDVLVDELPGPPPFRPINHSITLVDPKIKIRARAFPMADRYKAQFTAHVRKFVSSGFWSPAALDSACSLFAVPKHD